MKIIICTTPIRPVPTDYPPFGSLAVIQALQSVGYDPIFYDVDCLRPTFEQVVEYFKNEQPDVVGISAVVSTAYDYTKRLARALREALPNAKIVVGGNLAASSELLLRLCNVDVCVIGEGERVAINLARYFEEHRHADDFSALRRIKGIAYLDENREMIFTGYEIPIPADGFLDPDYSILERYSKISNFINDPLSRHDFAQDPRTYQPHRRGKRMGTVLSAKGCVARCTFCHRWDRGYRHFPVEAIIRRIHYLIDRYNVGFIQFGDENFGSDRRKLDELIELLKPLDLLWVVSGVRVRSVDLDLLRRMNESGCVAVYYGMETGSPKMLEVMEKNATLQQNIDAARWTHEAGIYTIYQMVLAMPGETKETVSETTEFLKEVTEFLDEEPYKRLSINYIQALPGTPVYEYARGKGPIGPTLQDEDAYLTLISDTNAADDTKFINFTHYDYLTVQSWARLIQFEVGAHYYRKRNCKPPSPRNLPGEGYQNLDDYSRGGYFNLKRMAYHPLFFRLMYPFRHLLAIGWAIGRSFGKLPLRQVLMNLLAFAFQSSKKRESFQDYRSLRRVVKDMEPPPVTISEQSMAPLRAGR